MGGGGGRGLSGCGTTGRETTGREGDLELGGEGEGGGEGGGGGGEGGDGGEGGVGADGADEEADGDANCEAASMPVLLTVGEIESMEKVKL